jgi:hypothetical protein
MTRRVRNRLPARLAAALAVVSALTFASCGSEGEEPVYMLHDFQASPGMRFSVTYDHGFYAVTVSPTVKPATFYAATVQASFAPAGNLCAVHVDPRQAPWKLTIAHDGAVLWAAASGYKTGPYDDQLMLTTDREYQLVFMHPAATTAPVTYAGVNLTCRRGAPGERVKSLKEQAMDEVMRPKLARQDEGRIPGQSLLVSSFEDTARQLRDLVLAGADDGELAGFLAAAYTVQEPLIRFAHAAELAGRDPRLVFATYLAHFAVSLSHAGGADPREILAQGDGTCWQQAVAADFIFRLLTGRAGEITSLDWLWMGHTVVKGDGYLLDGTDNIVIFRDAAEWNRMSPAERIAALERDAVFGYSRDVDPAGYNPFEAELGGRQVLRDGWIEFAWRYPFTIICCAVEPDVP